VGTCICCNLLVFFCGYRWGVIPSAGHTRQQGKPYSLEPKAQPPSLNEIATTPYLLVAPFANKCSHAELLYMHCNPVHHECMLQATQAQREDMQRLQDFQSIKHL
jgi:hypothetical protein